MEGYVKATELCDCDNEDIKRKAKELTEEASTPEEEAKAIFRFVRDEILFGFNPFDAKASHTLKKGIGFCVTKASLQVALLRAIGIPARYHKVVLSRESLKDIVPSFMYEKIPERIPYHPWCECYLSGRWVSCEVLFDKGLYEGACRKGILSKEKIPTIDWDGNNDLITVTTWILEDTGTFSSLDEVFKEAAEETKLPRIIAKFGLYYINKYINRLRKS